MDSILDSMKKLLGIHPEDNGFDIDLIIQINSVLSILNQLGAGPKKPLVISDNSATWKDFGSEDVEMVKIYMYLKIRTTFDPMATNTMNESFKKMADELEWRISVAVDSKEEIPNG